MSWSPIRALPELMKMIRPRFRSRMCGITALVHHHGPDRLVSITARQCSSSIVHASPGGASIPASFTSRSICPYFSNAKAAIASAWAGSRTSTRVASASSPRSRIPAATSAAFSCWMSATTTEAPSAASVSAMHRPIPWAAPVTIATCPSSSRSPISVSSWSPGSMRPCPSCRTRPIG